MSWYFLACFIAFIITLQTLLDQYLLRKYLPNNGLVALFMGELFYFLPLVVLAPFFPSIFELGIASIGFSISLGMLSTLAFIPYFWALEEDDTHIVLPLYQLHPVLVLLIGWLLLGEAVSLKLLFPCLLIIIAAMGLVYNFKTKKAKTYTFFLILSSCFLLSFFSLGKRYFALEEDWIAVSAWIAIGEFLSAIIAFSLRRDWFFIMIDTIKSSKGAVLLFSIPQEFLYICSLFLSVWGLALAPSAGIFSSVADSLLPAFGFILPATLALFLPKQFEKHDNLGLFVWKSACVAIIIIGSAFLYIETH